MMLAQAIQKAGSTKNTDILAALNNISNFQGVMGPLSLSKTQHVTDSTSTEIMEMYSAATGKWSAAPA
jgi:hypothetical protein